MSKFLDQAAFPLAEIGFSFLREDIRDGFARARHDDVVRVEKGKMQLIGDQSSDGRLAGAHKADEGNVNKSPRGAHRNELDDLRRIDTQFLPTRRRASCADPIILEWFDFDPILITSGFKT